MRRTRYKLEEARRKRESLFWAPPGGESLAQVMQRVDNLLLYMNRRFDGKRIIATCHGELMWAFRIRFERLTQLRYMEMERELKVSEKMHNGQARARAATARATARGSPSAPALAASHCSVLMLLSDGVSSDGVSSDGVSSGGAPLVASPCHPMPPVQVLIYSRRDPESGELCPDFRFTRSVCPWDTAVSGSVAWRSLQPTRDAGLLDDKTLWDRIDQEPRLYNNVSEPTTNCRPDSLDADFDALTAAAPSSAAAASSATAASAAAAAAALGDAAAAGGEPLRVLLLTKTPRWRHVARARDAASQARGEGSGSGQPDAAADAASSSEPNAAASSGRVDISDVNGDATELAASCAAHEGAVSALRSALAGRGIAVTEIAERQASAFDCRGGYAVVCAAGGDGTLLRASSLVSVSAL